MEFKITIPDEVHEKMKSLLEVRKGLQKNFDDLKSESLAKSIDAINGEINNAILISFYKSNEEWQ